MAVLVMMEALYILYNATYIVSMCFKQQGNNMPKLCTECSIEITLTNGIKRSWNAFRTQCRSCFTKKNADKERLRKGVVKHPCEICSVMCYRKYVRIFCSDKCKFLGYIKKTDSCWFWLGRKDDDGYGEIGLNGKILRAHRYAYELFKGEIDPELLMLHTCDKRDCVNPDHLFMGTADDNAKDMVKKDRQRRGSSVGTSKLIEDEVLIIKSLIKNGLSDRSIAPMFFVSECTIRWIRKGVTWKHV